MIKSLSDYCVQCLQKNIHKLNNIGDCNELHKYSLIRPILLKCSPQQIRRFEEAEPKLQEFDEDLWEMFCKKEFKLEEEEGSWRETFLANEIKRQGRLEDARQRLKRKMDNIKEVKESKKIEKIDVIKTPAKRIKSSGIVGRVRREVGLLRSNRHVMSNQPKK